MPGEFQVATELRTLPSEMKARATMNKYGCPVGMDFFTWMVLIGRMYLVQAGTEDAPIDTTPVDDTTLNMLVDVPTGKTIMLAEASCHVSDLTTGTLAQVLIEADNAKVRYSSGGTAFTPLNMNNTYSNGSGVNAYVGPDITAAAKTTGGSLEIARFDISSDAKATMLADENINFLWTARLNIPVIVQGPGSILLHFGSATADVTGYSQLKFIVL